MSAMSSPYPFAPEQRILVTGGAGFIGSALVWQLNRSGCERIVIADRLGRTDKWRNLAPLRFADYLEADDLIPQLESGALGSFSHVLHMGACSSTLERDATYLVRNNFEFTKRVAAWALRTGARFVYASSAATYGDGSAGMSDIVRDPQDLAGLRPLNAYGYSKQLFDQHALTHGLLDRIVGLKFFNVFGPNEAHKGDMRSLVQKAYEQIRDTGRVGLFKSYHPAYHDGEQRRDFVYVKDVVAMTLHLATQPSAGGMYNIGSGIAHTWLDLAGALFAAMGREPSIDFIDMPEAMRDRYQYFTQADISRARATGFAAPMTPLSAAIADYVTVYLQPDKRLGDESHSMTQR
ncbi:MAG TPA: ADP-glyceromanno-heptose 6-epimerase [Gemmatimonas sp.]|nr:ADP-glyceromanno-heptose 6-epimerase [Gemmatimonas sp.]